MNIPNRVSPVSFDSSLPKGYMTLDFLESTGTQYIDTGVKLSSESEVRCEYLLTKIVEGANQYLFDAQTRIDSTFTQFGFTLYNFGHPNDVYAYVRTSTVPQITIQRPEGKTSITLNKKGLTINDVFLRGTAPDEFILPLPCYLFADNEYGLVRSRAYVRVYSFSISRAGEMQVDYVPCISPDGKLGMYNRIDGSLKENDGTGQFIAGMTLPQARVLSLPAGGGEMTLSLPYEASVDRMVQEALEAARLNGWTLTVQYRDGELPAGWRREVSFLESTGEQWIDTGFTPKMGDELSFEVSCNNTTGNPSTLFSAGNDTNQLAGVALYVPGELPTGVTDFYIRYFRDTALPLRVSINTKEKIKISSTGECFLNEKLLFVNQPKGEVNTSLLLCKRVAAASGNFFFGCIYAFSISRAGTPQCNLIPCIDDEGIPVMWDSVQKKALPNAGTGAFIVGLETVEDVRKFFLPPSGGELTLSLPQAASTDFDSQLALDRARAHGWTLSIQYREELDVPEGYKRLEFLESTGTQYIDTGIKLSNESEVRCKYLIKVRPLSSTWIYGGEVGTQLKRYGLLAYLSGEAYENRIYAYCGGDGKVPRSAIVRDETQFNNVISTVVNSERFTVNDKTANFSSTVDVFESTYAVIFGFLNENKVTKSKCRVYSFSISRSGEMQVDYVPCISPEGKVGMYNKVDGSLKENAGTGSFIAGLATVDDVRTLYLPEISGELTVSVPADTTDEDIDLMQFNNSTWLIAVQRRDNEN